MNDLLVGVLTALLSTNSPTVVSNWVNTKPPRKIESAVVSTNSPADLALKRVMEMDDQIRGEIDDLLNESGERRTDAEDKALKERIAKKLDPVRQAYEAIINQYPRYAKARIAFGSFLSESSDEPGAFTQWSKAKELDPQDPAAWNNLANVFGHRGPVTNAFYHYAKAIELNPQESTYYHNLATTMYMFRADAANLLKKQVLDVLYDAMAFYRRALELDPDNFILAADLAQSYYGFPQSKTGDPVSDQRARIKLADEALTAWTNAFRIARDDAERQGVQVHFVRQHINAGRLDVARQALSAVTNSIYDATKKALNTKIETIEKQRESPAGRVPERSAVPPPVPPRKPNDGGQ